MQASKDVMGKVFFALCKTIDTPVSLGAWLRYKYSHIELARMGVNPRHYTSAESFKKDYASTSYLKKYVGLRTGLSLEDEALRSFKTSELQCGETNERFRSLANVVNPRLHAILYCAQRKIANLLGIYSTFAVSEAYGWGPGATLEIPRRRAYVDLKLAELPITVSRSALSMLKNEIEGDLHWSTVILGVVPDGRYSLLKNVFRIEDSSRVTTVPKNALTDRIIAVEPRGNGFLQKGFGAFIRRRLRTVGIDLDNQAANQEGAHRAFNDELATIDLKAASDTVSTGLVLSLLPYDWADAMDALRTRSAVMPDGSKVILEKFSSMGNGFTFELETLIFWAIAQSICDIEGRRGRALVYGDDIIVPASTSTELCLALQFCGFTVNDEKSFIDGVFYESCGKHYFMGEDVTPAYQKELVDDLLPSIRCANRLIRLAFRSGLNRSLDGVYFPAWDTIRRSSLEFFKGFRFKGRRKLFPELPLGTEGDDGLVLPYNDFRFRRQHPVDILNHGIVCTVVKDVHQSLPGIEEALYAYTLRRGVVTAIPFNGDVVDPNPSHRVFSTRRVFPTWKFSVSWDS